MLDFCWCVPLLAGSVECPPSPSALIKALSSSDVEGSDVDVFVRAGNKRIILFLRHATTCVSPFGVTDIRCSFSEGHKTNQGKKREERRRKNFFLAAVLVCHRKSKHGTCLRIEINGNEYKSPLCVCVCAVTYRRGYVQHAVPDGWSGWSGYIEKIGNNVTKLARNVENKRPCLCSSI